MIIEGRHYLDGSPISIEVKNGVINRIKRLQSTDNDVYIAPGFIDNQVNGCMSIDFTGPDLSVGDVVKATHALWRTGVTTYMPTIVTCSPERMLHNVEIIVIAARDKSIANSIAGIHLEGPYISPLEDFRGAHNAKWIRPPDWQELQRVNEIAGGLIKQVTLAPEQKGSIDFIESCTLSGITVGLGHHNADGEQIKCAVDAGARIATHLGNGLANNIDRHKNPLWPQLSDDRLTVSLIADGFHLTPEELQVFYRSKGVDRVMLTSDMTKLFGLPPGVYEWEGEKIEVTEEGMITMPSQNVLAGASLPLSRGVENMMSCVGCTLAEAVHMASCNQARLFGLGDRGELSLGKRADIVLFALKSGRLSVEQTIVGGRVVYS